MYSVPFLEQFEQGNITEEHLIGMKVIVKTLSNKCKELNNEITQRKEAMRHCVHYCHWELDTIQELEEQLKYYVNMKVLAERTMRRYKHIKEGRENG